MSRKKRIIIISIVIGVILIAIAGLCIAMMMNNGGTMDMGGSTHVNHGNMWQGDRGGHHGGPGGSGMFGGHGVMRFLLHFLMLVVAVAIVFAGYKLFTRRYQIVKKPTVIVASPEPTTTATEEQKS